MSIADRIAAKNKTPTATITVGGRRWAGALGISIGQELGQAIAAGTIWGVDPPVQAAPGADIRANFGYDREELALLTGFVTEPGIDSYPNRTTYNVQDALWLAQIEERPIATSPINNIEAAAAIAQILTLGGITRMQIADIGFPSDPGTPWLMGQLTPVSWTSDTTALAAAQEIAATAGYWLYCDPGGTARVRAVELRPATSAFRVFRRGEDLLIKGPPSLRRPGDQVRNEVRIEGANTGVENAMLWDTFLATHALYPGKRQRETLAYRFLEFIADVTATAERKTGLLNRQPRVLTGTIMADPRLAVGMTVGIVDPAIGISSQQNYIIYRLQTDIDLTTGVCEQQLTLDGGIGDSGYSLNPPPVAVLGWTLEKETVDGDPVTIVSVIASDSYPQDEGEIVTYEFSTPDTPYDGPATSPAPNTSPTFQFVFPDTPSPVTIALEVTATNSKTDTAEVTVDLAGDALITPTTEALQVAAGAAVTATSDGGATWPEQAETTTLVPQVDAGVWDTALPGDSATYGAISAGGTELRQTLDGYATAPAVINTAGGTITALSRNPRNAARVWRAVGDTVQRSIDGGMTFTSWGAPLPGTDVRCIIEDPALDNSVFAAAGADIYQSLGDGAPGWGVLYAGPVGATARWFVRSEDGTITWVAYTGTFSGSPLQRIEGPLGVTFPVVSPAVSEIRALDLSDMVSPTAPVLLAADQEARLWRIDALTGLSIVQSAEAMPAGTIVQHMVHSRQAKLVYLADFDSVTSGTGAVRKWLYEADILLPFQPLATGQQAHMVGIIGRPQIAAQGLILKLPFGQFSGGLPTAGNRLWIYDAQANTWTGKAIPLIDETQMQWIQVLSNPLNYRELLIYAYGNGNRIYYSPDFGDSWELVLSDAPQRFDQSVPWAHWSGAGGGRWAYSGHDIGGADYLYRGVRDTSLDTDTFSYGRFHTADGLSDEIVFMYLTGFSSTETDYFLPDNSVDPGPSGSAAFGRWDRVSGTRRMAHIPVATAGTQLSILMDYHGGSYIPISGTEGNSVAVLADGTILIGGRSSTATGVQEVTGAFSGSPVVTTDSFGGLGTGQIMTDRQTQTLAAVTVGSGTMLRTPDGTWITLPMPADLNTAGAAGFVNWVEPVNAGGA